jgi:hypothetical protein
MSTITLGDPALNLQVTKQRTTVVVEPTSTAGGDYDSAEITTAIYINNDQAREVEFIVPYSTEDFSASLAVISAGQDAFKKRLTQVDRISGNLSRIKPYLRKLGLAEESFDTQKELTAIAKQFRAGTLELPAGPIVVKIQVTAMVEPKEINGVKTFAFRAYSPLPAFGIVGGHVALTLAVLFKGDENIKPQVSKADVSNPFGDNLPVAGTPILGQAVGEDVLYWWKWLIDPVVDFEYHY